MLFCNDLKLCIQFFLETAIVIIRVLIPLKQQLLYKLFLLTHCVLEFNYLFLP